MPRNANNTPVDKLSNYSINFSGTTKSINCGANDIVNGVFSVSLWMKRDLISGDSTQSFFTKDNVTSDRTFNCYLNKGGGYFQFFISDTGAFISSKRITTIDTVTDEEWHHLVFINAGSAGQMQIYIDGQLAQINSTPKTGLDNLHSSSIPTIIGDNNANTGEFGGSLSQYCVFDYALDQNQINYLYNLNNPMVPGTVNLTAPVAYWPLGDNSNPNTSGSFPNISVGADSVFDFSTQDNIESPHIDMTGAMSISGWFKTTDTGYNMIYQEDEALRSPAGPDRNWFFSTVNNVLRFTHFYDSGGSNVLNTSGVTVNDGNWHHGVFVWDGTTGTDSMKTFVDGVLRAKLTAAKTDRSNDDITGMIGGSNSTYDMNGELSNIQIWDTNLTYGTASNLGDTAGGQVAQLYNNGQPLMTGTQPQEANLEAWYKLNQSANYNQGVSGIAFEVDQIGTPDVSGGGDHAFVNPALSPLSFECQDLNSVGTGSPNYDLAFPVNNGVRWKSLKVNGKYNNLYLSANVSLQNGSTSFGFAGARLIYVIDSGAEVTWQDISVNPSDPNSLVAFNPTVGSLSCENSIQIFIDCGTANYSAARVRIDNVTIKEGGASGTNIYNEDFGNQSGAGWNGTYTAATSTTYVDPSWQIPDNRSAYPQSFDFNGSNQYIQPGTNVSLGITDAITVSAWVRIPTTNTGGPSPSIQEIICEDNSGSRNWALNWRHQSVSNKYFLFAVWHTDGTATSIQSTGIVPNDGKWHHVIGTFDGTTNANGLKLYVDNTLFQNTANGEGVRSIFGVSPSIGSLENGSTWMFEGNISNVYVWDTDLNSTQVDTLYNNGVPLTNAIVTDSLKLWYKLDNTELFDGTNWTIQNQKTPANYESALYFTGGSGNEHLETPSNSDLLMAGSHSFSVWLNVDVNQVDTTNYIFDKGGLDYSLGIAGTALRLIYYNYYDSNGPSGNNKVIVLDSTWKTKYHNGWNHVLVSVDQPNLTITVTTNGTDTTVITTPPPGTPPGNWLPEDYVSPDQSTGNLNIMSYNGTTLSLAGYISNLAFYNGTALTTAEALTLYNNGTPENNISFSPTSWWKIDNTSTGLLDNAGSANLTNTGGVELDTYVTVLSGFSSNMTEQNLVNNNVSVLNGESEGMNSTNLVQSNLTRTQPFSNYSTNFNSIDYYTSTGGGFLNGATTASISAWVNMATKGTGGTSRPIVSNWGVSPQRQYLIRHLNTAANGFQFYVHGPSGPSSTAFVVANTGNSFTVNPNTWYNVVGTWDGVEVKIYINGILRGSQTASSGSLSSSTSPNLIGNYSNTYMDGSISNAAFWTDTVLNEDDILNIYNNGITQDLNNFRVTPTKWFPLDESYTYYNGSVMVARDVIGGSEVDGVNIAQSDIVGNAPGSDANGSGNNLAIGDLKGNMYNSDKNAYSINMADYADGVTNPANSGRSTDTP
jgi:hypothetical protein